MSRAVVRALLISALLLATVGLPASGLYGVRLESELDLTISPGTPVFLVERSVDAGPTCVLSVDDEKPAEPTGVEESIASDEGAQVFEQDATCGEDDESEDPEDASG